MIEESTNLALDLRISRPLIALFKGVVYADQTPDNWQNLLERQGAITDHVAVLGLDLIVDESEGYAFLRQKVHEEQDIELPRLMARRQLSYPVSLLLALLREKLAEHDAVGEIGRASCRERGYGSGVVGLLQA